MSVDLYLASQSPRRRELLRQIGVRHQPIDTSVVEIPFANEQALDYVQRLARAKAAAGFANVLSRGLPLAPVLGADTLGLIDNQILEKPSNQSEAGKMLRRLSGRTHQVITAVALHTLSRQAVRISVTEVSFRVLSDMEIECYWASGEPLDKAGGYAIQGLGAVFVERINGSYSGVMGLPIESTWALLTEFDIPCWQPLGPIES